MSLLSAVKFIQISPNKELAHYEIEPKIAVFSLLNVPQKMTKEELLTLTKLDPANLLRVYKKSLFWIIVVDENLSFNITKTKLKDLRADDFSDGSLKFDSSNFASLMKSVQKILQNRDYQKEASDLKAEKRNSTANNMNNYNSNSSNKERTNSEAFSWRKKSTDGNGSNAALVSPKMSEE